MAAQEEQVKIIAWPEQPAKVEHGLKVEGPCPVSIKFEKDPANVVVNVVAREKIPVCISLCEPVVAESEYEIGINILGRSWGAITLKGATRISSYSSKETPARVEGAAVSAATNIRPKRSRKG